MNQKAPSMSDERRRASRYGPTFHLRVMVQRESLQTKLCYVQNFSRTGVLLVCHCTSEEPIFKIGDHVDINFRDRNIPQQSGSVSGDIVRVIADRVAVDYSAAEKTARKKFLSLREKTAGKTSPVKQQTDETAVEPVVQKSLELKNQDAATSTREQLPVSIENSAVKSRRVMLASALIVIALALGLLGLYNYRLQTRLNEMSSTLETLKTQLATKGDREATSGLALRLSDLESRQQQLADAIDNAPAKQAPQVTVEKLKPEIADPKPTRSAPAAPVTGRKSEAANGQERWVINVMALSDADAARNVVAKARAAGITIESRQIDVGNRSMHRLFISGLGSRQEASELAETVQKTLALKQAPWIAKQ